MFELINAFTGNITHPDVNIFILQINICLLEIKINLKIYLNIYIAQYFKK